VIIVDRALEERAVAGNPVRVGMVGAGTMGRAIANQITHATPGMELVAIANRHPDRGADAFREVGAGEAVAVGSAASLDRAVAAGQRAVTDDPAALCEATCIDAIIEVTGTVGHAAGVILDAIGNGKHIVLMNAEVDGTLGPILKHHADRAGVVYTASDGDQPGVQMNLYRFVRGIGMEPLVCGNVKGLHDPYRTPATQRGFAERWGQSPTMVTSFADGTKIAFEQAVVANGTGMRVASRGMSGAHFDGHVDDAVRLYDVDELRRSGAVVDYLVGAKPAPGVFVFGTVDDPKQRHLLDLYKLGPGPLYSFYTPYHLCHFEVPASVARAVLFGDAVLAPAGPPMVDVVAAAKRDLEAGQTLDGLGGYSVYGLAENADVAAKERLLPVGLAEGCRMRRDLPRDSVLTYDDVDVPPGRLEDRLRAEQAEYFHR
jgi:predicted homoserine dehydrogenase-like protein